MGRALPKLESRLREGIRERLGDKYILSTTQNGTNYEFNITPNSLTIHYDYRKMIVASSRHLSATLFDLPDNDTEGWAKIHDDIWYEWAGQIPDLCPKCQHGLITARDYLCGRCRYG